MICYESSPSPSPLSLTTYTSGGSNNNNEGLRNRRNNNNRQQQSLNNGSDNNDNQQHGVFHRSDEMEMIMSDMERASEVSGILGFFVYIIVICFFLIFCFQLFSVTWFRFVDVIILWFL